MDGFIKEACNIRKKGDYMYQQGFIDAIDKGISDIKERGAILNYPPDVLMGMYEAMSVLEMLKKNNE